ncbi:unnamed protein product [Dovyalis caffra]|uniref:Uncharacterized protein n=1 Tax=Dovyalis caffra TaxID=77055 RepID=A0AAV1QP47_9ROSI|nr:unnamed protein product [Dovyalis caffra]
MAKRCLPFLLLLQLWLQLAVSHSIVKFLPGFQGPLPFHLETAYVGVDEAQDVQLFYYFIKSQGNPKEDPLLLWLTGGPGCSSLSALAFEIGPIRFEEKEYNGSLPALVLNPHSWTQVANIILVDLPAGTGFSYARNPLAFQRRDFKQVSQADQFLRKWLMHHQEFLSNPVYIAGDSYSGLTVPAIVQKISNGNNEDMKPLINLKGYMLGNPVTDPTFDDNSKVPFAHGMGLISDELYESYKELLATYWANDDDVRKALHVQEGSIGEWQRCNFNYTREIHSSIKYHIDLGIIGYRRLIYSGDHDMVIPFLGTQAWIRSLNYSIVDDWRPWHSHGQVAGYTRTYSNQLTFATVMGGGHTAPEYKPAECFAMFKRWIIQEPL